MAKSKKPAPKKPTKTAKKPAAKTKLAVKVKAKTAAKKASVKKPLKTVVKKAASKAPVKSAKPASKGSEKGKQSVQAKPVTKPPAARSAAVTTPGKKSEGYFKTYLKPLDDRLVVLVGANERVTPGGLFIPDTVTDVSGNFQGQVMAIGRGHMNKKGRVRPLDVSVGDKVVFSQFSGSQIDVDGNNIMIIRESDVLGIVK